MSMNSKLRDALKRSEIGLISLVFLNFLIYFGNYSSGYNLGMGLSWNLLLYQFSHVNIDHLVSNMILLVFLGHRVEHKLGPLRLWIAYLFCGIVAGLGFALANPSMSLIGASGAIFGMLSLYLCSTKSLTSKLLVGGLYLVMLFSELSNLSSGLTSVAVLAHLLGAFAGVIAFILLKPKLREN